MIKISKDNFEYDSDEDLLYIYNNADKEDVYGSISFGNFVFDIGTSGKVVGLEIDNASKTFGVTPEQMSKLSFAKIAVSTQSEMIRINFAVKINNANYQYVHVVPRNKIAISC